MYRRPSQVAWTLILPLLLVVATALAAGPWQEHLSDTPRTPDPDDRVIIDPGHSVARVWNETLLDAIRIDRPKPPVHARNLFHLSIAMWDAWAAYDPDAVGYITTEKQLAADANAAREEAMSYAALRLLQYRFPGGGFDPVDGQPCQPGAAVSQAEFLSTMIALGYDPNVTSTVGDSPAALGNRIGEAVIAFGQTDGAFEGFFLCYPDDTGYFSINPVLIFKRSGTDAVDPNRWQILAFDFQVTQNGLVIGQSLQSFTGVAWADVQSFNIPPVPPGGTLPPVDCGTGPGALSPIFDPGCPPQLGGVGDQELKDAVVELIRFSSYADPTDGVEIDFSPGVYGNNPLGTDDGTGHPINPRTCEPYAPNVIKRGDWARVISEFWADGPHSETPPGHWNTLANYVSDHPDLGQKRIGGPNGPLVDDLEWDTKLYLALNGAVHDAAIAAWGTKQYYDSSRPITLIRYMGGLGQSTTGPGGMSYHPDGLPLVPDLIEVITDETIAIGGRHQHLSAFCAGGGLAEDEPCVTDADCPDDGPFDGFCESSVGKMAIRAWQGGPDDPENELGGAGWIRAVDWMPYQKDTFVTPPFPGYTSGHSAFSQAAAVVLARFTGDEFFPGGLGTFVAEKDEYLAFEQGPSETVTLEWATYADAADEAGLSRRFGGIHPWFDDFPSRIQGADVGQSAWERAQDFYNHGLDPGDGDGTDEGSDDEDTDEDSDDEGTDEDSDEGVCPGRGDGGGLSIELREGQQPAGGLIQLMSGGGHAESSGAQRAQEPEEGSGRRKTQEKRQRDPRPRR